MSLISLNVLHCRRKRISVTTCPVFFWLAWLFWVSLFQFPVCGHWAWAWSWSVSGFLSLTAERNVIMAFIAIGIHVYTVISTWPHVYKATCYSNQIQLSILCTVHSSLMFMFTLSSLLSLFLAVCVSFLCMYIEIKEEKPESNSVCVHIPGK